jgi:NifU-like protein
MSGVYPQKVIDRMMTAACRTAIDDANAVGRAASFECGTFIEFRLNIDKGSKQMVDMAYRSNGCGYMLATAELLADKLAGVSLTGLNGSDGRELISLVTSELGSLPPSRGHCTAIVIDALKSAFADFRQRQVAEFAGEKALICTCFGVSEETVENVVRELGAKTVEQVGELSRAGTGCGSCQMLIREMIDVA